MKGQGLWIFLIAVGVMALAVYFFWKNAPSARISSTGVAYSGGGQVRGCCPKRKQKKANQALTDWANSCIGKCHKPACKGAPGCD